MPNSSTFIPNFFAVKKCPSSWETIKNKRERKAIMIVRIMILTNYDYLV